MTERIDLYSSFSHYLDHLLPVFLALDPSERGDVWLSPQIFDLADAVGLPAARCGLPAPSGRPCLVAGYRDHATVGRRTILLEHGAGQQYRGDARSREDPSYAGSPGYDRCVLFLAPHDRVAQLWRKRYPSTPAVAVGCPKLDRLHAKLPRRMTGSQSTVAVSFHWDCRLIPETTSAWPHFDAALPAFAETMRANGVRVLGHAHPRIARRLRPRWDELGVEWADAHSVLSQADLLAVDNSSFAPEFASLGKPVLWLNAPWFRRDVEHHGRFWEWSRGQVECDDPDRLADAVLGALADPPEVRAAREAMVASVYVATDGGASQRAVDAIRAVIHLG